MKIKFLLSGMLFFLFLANAFGQQSVSEIKMINAAQIKERLAADKTQKRPLVIYFWASWCGICRREIPAFEAIYKKYAARGVDFLFVSMDDASEFSQMKGYLEMQNVGVPTRWFDSRTQGTFLDQYNKKTVTLEEVLGTRIDSFPRTLIYNSQGELVLEQRGSFGDGQMEADIGGIAPRKSAGQSAKMKNK